MDKLNSYTEMWKFCCIANLIRFMMNESEKLMKGSENEEDFFIVHDSLVLMYIFVFIIMASQRCLFEASA